MTAVYITMFLILLVAIAVGGVVAIGLKGALADRAPKLTTHFAQAARHMNGDAEAPQALVDLMPERLAGARR